MTILRRFRDTITGRYTTATDAEARPSATVSETPDLWHQETLALRHAHLEGLITDTQFFSTLDAILEGKQAEQHG